MIINAVQNVSIVIVAIGVVLVAIGLRHVTRTIRSERELTDLKIARLSPPDEDAHAKEGPRFPRPM
jgi:uncharacterized membrane protein YidH (DUF202 family)